MAEEQRARGLNKACVLIIVVAGMERFAFKGVASNMVTYLTDVMDMSNSSAAKMINTWRGYTFMLPLFVATLADSYWDRYSTIVACSFLYVLGLLALTTTTILRPQSPSNKTNSFSYLYWSLYMISTGQGGYNPSLQALGAEQAENEHECLCTQNNENSNKKTLFFQSWYFGTCSGTLLGNLLMPYIQDTLGWSFGFAIPATAMIISVAVFSCGNKIYGYNKAKVVDFLSFKDVFCAIKGCVSKMRNGSKITLARESDMVELELQEKSLCHKDIELSQDSENNEKSTVHPHEMAKVIIHLLPIWSTLLMFAVIFEQPPTFFTKQGMAMKRNLGPNFLIPPATLQATITISIVLLIPFYDKIFIPITRFFTRNEKGITVMQRMGIGMFLSVVAMVIAALVESKRVEIGIKSDEKIASLSIFWLLPQYILLGISDIFTIVGMQEFFYSEVPVKMRTMGIALYISVFGVGSFFSVFLISGIEFYLSSRGLESWFSDDMREARLDKYYWLLAFGSAISLIVFVILGKIYRSRHILQAQRLTILEHYIMKLGSILRSIICKQTYYKQRPYFIPADVWKVDSILGSITRLYHKIA